jgi:hypothetical protein
MPIEISKAKPNYIGEIPTNSTKIKIEVDFSGSRSSINTCKLRLYNADYMPYCHFITLDDKNNLKVINLEEHKIIDAMASNYCLEIERTLIDLETGIIKAKIEF